MQSNAQLSFSALCSKTCRLCTAADVQTFSAHILQGAMGYLQPLILIHSRKAWRSKSHVFLPKCQGQGIPCQTNMENKPEELQLCLKTRDSFEAILARKPWPHLSVSCYGELDAWTHINTYACTTTNSLMTNFSDCMMAGSEAGGNIFKKKDCVIFVELTQ